MTLQQCFKSISLISILHLSCLQRFPDLRHCGFVFTPTYWTPGTYLTKMTHSSFNIFFVKFVLLWFHSWLPDHYKYCTCHDSTAVVTCAKFCCDYTINILIRTKFPTSVKWVPWLGQQQVSCKVQEWPYCFPAHCDIWAAVHSYCFITHRLFSQPRICRSGALQEINCH